jgi:hypothetical protein
LEAELDKEEESKLKDEQKGPDLYPDILEDKYHNAEKMVSLGVLEKEKSLCYKIINYKKKMNKEYYYYEQKKKNLSQKIKSITSLIEKKTWNITLYKGKTVVKRDIDQKDAVDELVKFIENDRK